MIGPPPHVAARLVGGHRASGDPRTRTRARTHCHRLPCIAGCRVAAPRSSRLTHIAQEQRHGCAWYVCRALVPRCGVLAARGGGQSGRKGGSPGGLVPHWRSHPLAGAHPPPQKKQMRKGEEAPRGNARSLAQEHAAGRWTRTWVISFDRHEQAGQQHRCGQHRPAHSSRRLPVWEEQLVRLSHHPQSVARGGGLTLLQRALPLPPGAGRVVVRSHCRGAGWCKLISRSYRFCR